MLWARIHSSKVLKAQSLTSLVLTGITPFAAVLTSFSVDVANLDEDEVAFPVLLPFNDNESRLFFDSEGMLDILDSSTSIQVVLVK